MTSSGPSATNYVIIVAAGSGSRMNSLTPKQFMLLDGRPLLMHSMEAFYSLFPFDPRIIVVLNEQHDLYWKELCKNMGFTIPHQLVIGGETRFHSVKNALNILEDDGLVAVHDAARPLVDRVLINRCYKEADIHGSAIPVLECRDSLRKKTSSGGSRAIDRKDILIVQTPQTFKTSILKSAYNCQYREAFTDDASVVEAAGTELHLVAGSQKNFKVTYPEDLQMASTLLEGR